MVGCAMISLSRMPSLEIECSGFVTPFATESSSSVFIGRNRNPLEFEFDFRLRLQVQYLDLDFFFFPTVWLSIFRMSLQKDSDGSG